VAAIAGTKRLFAGTRRLITVYAAMHVILGFLLAAFLLLLVQPAYRRRIERFASESVKRSLPLTEAEINADKDRIRAGFAIDVHKLEMKLEDSAMAAARQSVEINRRDAKVHDLEQAIETHKLSVEEHENARRVLEQAILDRLPKVEQRLSEARKLLVQRDREIMLLTDTGAKQSEALEEATQINTQQRDELERTKAALETRAARNRETLGDPRFDGEVALRSEIEELRAKSRDQANLIDKLQKVATRADSNELQSAQSKNEIERLKSDLAKAEAKALSFEGNTDETRARLEAQVRDLEAAASANAAEMAKMMAALKAFADNANDPATGRTSATLSAKVEISQLQTEVEEQRRTIESLRAEIAGSNERLVRQSQYFRDELRRLGAAPAQATETAASTETEAPRRSLAERIAAPRVPGPVGADMSARTPTGTVLTALNGGAGDASTAAEAVVVGSPENDSAAPRRPRLLDRISGLDK
jgi:DNA repair exonuclease SbcCD ATPase subunit